MERTKDTLQELQNPEYIRNKIYELIQDYKQNPNNEIDGFISDITTGQFEGILSDIRRKIFDASRILQTGCDFDEFYNLPVLQSVADVYADLCRQYNKVPSITGFAILTGLSSDVLNKWDLYIIPDSMSMSIQTSNFMGLDKRTVANAIKADICKRLKENRENAITNKLLDLGQAVGLIAVANHEYKWNIERLRDETQVRALTLAELPKLMSTDSTNTAGIETHEMP